MKISKRLYDNYSIYIYFDWPLKLFLEPLTLLNFFVIM